jgi:hypothetical protein
MQCIASSVVFVAVETCSNNSPSSNGYTCHIIDFDDEMDSEIEGETVSKESSIESQKVKEMTMGDKKPKECGATV